MAETEGVVASQSAPLQVSEILEGKRLVLLGGTGFLGKIFWSMLLHRIPTVGKLYLLVRSSRGRDKATGKPKKGMSSEERFWKQIVPSPVLDPLRQQHGEQFEAFLRDKIVPIDGDVGRTNCGLDDALVAELHGTIDAVVNVAGVVDFYPPLDEALDANAFGAKNLVTLARALGDVPLYHTSTCYTAGRRKGPILEEDPCSVPFPRVKELGLDLWDPDREIRDCLDIVAQANHRCDDAFRQSEFQERARKNLLERHEPTAGPAFDEELTRVRRRFVADRLIEAGTERATHWGWPNIYTYTKSIGEQVIARSGLRYSIGRPACCESTIEFPFAGWNEGVSTSAPIIYLVMEGAMEIPGRDTILDFIPTDMVAAGMILSVAELIEGTHSVVYHYGTSDENPVTSARLGELIGLYKRKYYQRTQRNGPLLSFLAAHIEPVIMGMKDYDRFGAPALARATEFISEKLALVPQLQSASTAVAGVAKTQARVTRLMKLFAPFTHDDNGPFSTKQTTRAYERLRPEERAKLPWRPRDIEWRDWMMNVHLPAFEKFIYPEMQQKAVRETKAARAHETLVSLLAQMAERHDLALALQHTEQDGLSRVTFRDVQTRAHALAHRLRASGVQRADRVLLIGRNAPEWAVAFFGILSAGAVAAPVDRELDVHGLEAALRASAAKVALVDDASRARFGEALSRAGVTMLAFTDGGSAPVAPLDVTVAPDDDAVCLFTAGTTGTPKAVRLTHRNFTTLLASLAPLFPIGAKDRLLSVLPLHHAFELTCGLLLPFSRGARVVYLDEPTEAAIAETLRRDKVTAIVAVPEVWQAFERRLLESVRERGPVAETLFSVGGDLQRTIAQTLGIDAGRALFGSLLPELANVRVLISGGATLPKETQRTFARLGLPLTQGYGLTEAAPVLTVTKPGAREPAGQVGRAIPGVELRIDAPNEQGVGEILARGPNVMAGYANADATEQVLDADGWLHTGDLGRLDRKGRLTVVGRKSELIVTANGEKLLPEDIEHRLSTVAHVAELAIVGVLGADSTERIACLAVPAAGPVEQRKERREQARHALEQAIKQVPSKLRPTLVYLVDLPLPRSTAHKILRAEVRARVQKLYAASEGKGSTERRALAALAAVSGRHIDAISEGDRLVADLALDDIAMGLLQACLDELPCVVTPADLALSSTVGEVLALLRRTSTEQPSRTQQVEDAPLVSFDWATALTGAAAGLLRKAQGEFFERVMDVDVSGQAFIPHNRRVLVVANLASHLDMGLVHHALGSYAESLATLAAKDYFFADKGVKQTFFERVVGLSPLDRRRLREALRETGELLMNGKSVLLFPEDTRSSDGDIREFKPLVGHLALTHGVDILPLHLRGTFEAMRKGVFVPMQRKLGARIGPLLRIEDLRRKVAGMSADDAAREVARLAREAVVGLRDGHVLDLAHQPAPPEKPVKHPLEELFEELPTRFRPGQVRKPVTYYFTLGNDDAAKWTVRVDKEACEIKQGKPAGNADCVLKTTAELFTRIVREAYTPTPAEFLSGAVKSNDVALLLTFQKVFELGARG